MKMPLTLVAEDRGRIHCSCCGVKHMYQVRGPARHLGVGKGEDPGSSRMGP